MKTVRDACTVQPNALSIKLSDQVAQLDAQLDGLIPAEGDGAVHIAYMQGLWPGLVRFLENPRIPLDNNGTERAIRGPVVGRKNLYGSLSRRGTEVAPTFYTIFATAKALQLDPAEYLRAVVLKALASPGSVTVPADLKATT